MTSSLVAAIAIVIGAIPGALSRYWIGVWAKQRFGNQFPIGTLIVNLAGCFSAGILVRFAQSSSLYSPEIDLLLRVGFLGSFTTFSTYAYESFSLLKSGHQMRSLIYWSGSAIVGLIAVYMGIELANLLLQ